MNGKKRYIEIRGTPAAIKKSIKDSPKERLVHIDIKGGRIVLTEDKHQLHLKLKKDFGIKFKYIKEVNHKVTEKNHRLRR